MSKVRIFACIRSSVNLTNYILPTGQAEKPMAKATRGMRVASVTKRKGIMDTSGSFPVIKQGTDCKSGLRFGVSRRREFNVISGRSWLILVSYTLTSPFSLLLLRPLHSNTFLLFHEIFGFHLSTVVKL